MSVENLTGVFEIERVKNKANDNHRVIVRNEDEKQVGSTFDEDISDKLLAYPKGATLTLEIDKSGRFWDIVGASLADDGDQSGASSGKKSSGAKQGKPPFNKRDMTYFIGSSARVIAALVSSSKEYRDNIEEQSDMIEAIHKDIVFGANLMFNESNK